MRRSSLLKLLFIFALLSEVGLFSNSPYFIWISGSTVFIYLIILSLGVFNIRLNYFIKSINSLNTDKCMLTFDDGPCPVNTLKILDTLDGFNIKALFFIIGHKAEKHAEIVEEIVKRGHLIGNHTYSHSNFLASFSLKKLTKDISFNQEVIHRFTEKENVLFRPPIGITTPRIAKVLKRLNLQSVGWNLRSFDTKSKSRNRVVK